jgi:drug/metabolite transporter (DMT)-like permease
MNGGLTRTQAWFVLALSIAILGIHWPIMKIGLRSVGPEWFGVLRLVGASVGYAAVLAAQRHLVWPTRRDLPMVLGLGVFQMTLMIGLVTFGVTSIGAGRSAILCYTTPLWVIPGAILLLGERVDRWQIVGLAVGMAGLAVLFNPLDFDWGDRKVLIGNASVLLGALSWAAAILQVRGHRWDSNPLQLLPFQSLIGAVLLFPVAGFAEGWAPHIDWNLEFVLAFSFTALIASCVGYWGTVAAGQRLPAIAVSLAQLTTPVIGYAASAVWVGEAPSWRDIGGLALIIVGVGIASALGRRRDRARQPVSPRRERSGRLRRIMAFRFDADTQSPVKNAERGSAHWMKRAFKYANSGASRPSIPE